MANSHSLHMPVVIHDTGRVPQKVTLRSSGKVLSLDFYLNQLKPSEPPWHRRVCPPQENLPLQHLPMVRNVVEEPDDSPTLPGTVQQAILGHIISLASFLLSPHNGKCGKKSFKSRRQSRQSTADTAKS